MSRMPWKGAIVSKATKEHQDPRTKRYRDDQQRQRTERRAAGKALLLEKRADITSKEPEHERLGLEFVLDRSGKELTVEEHMELLAERAESRSWYWVERTGNRKGTFKREFLRERETITPLGPDGLPDLTKKKYRREVPREKIKVVRYEAFMHAPHHSFAWIQAAKTKRRKVVLRLQKQLSREEVIEYERFTKQEVVANPHHVKLWASHSQLSSVRVDQANNYLGIPDFPHLGRAMLGAYRLRELYGFTAGEKLDEVTGTAEANKGLEEALDDRGDRALDLHMAKWRDRGTEDLLATRAYAVLRRFVARAFITYKAMKAEEIRFLMEPDAAIVTENKELKAQLASERADNADLTELVGILRRQLEVGTANKTATPVAVGKSAKGVTPLALAEVAPVTTPANAATPAPAAAAPAAAATEKKPTGPLFTAEESLAALQAANDLVKTGADLSGLTDRQREIVEIKPAERVKRTQGEGGKLVVVKEGDKEVMEAHPFAGKVGLTPKAHQSIMAVINTTTSRLAKRDTITVEEADTLTLKKNTYSEVIEAAKASMGIEAKSDTNKMQQWQQAMQPDES